MTIAIVVVCGIVGIYLYVMGLCYLCDLYDLRRQKKRDEEEMKRKERMWKTLADAEAMQRARMDRRKDIAEARKLKTEKAGMEKARKPQPRTPSKVRQPRAAHA